MLSNQRTNWPVVGAICLLTIVIVVIILWPFHELIGFIMVGLGILAVLVLLGIRIMEAVADYKSRSADTEGKYNEQGLRQRRLRPFRGGQYEIPLDNDKTDMPPLQKRRQEPYAEGYGGDDPKDPYRGWE